jgi:hypothetical protein
LQNDSWHWEEIVKKKRKEEKLHPYVDKWRGGNKGSKTEELKEKDKKKKEKEKSFRAQVRERYQLRICNSQGARGRGGSGHAPFSGVGRSLVGKAVAGRW